MSYTTHTNIPPHTTSPYLFPRWKPGCWSLLIAALLSACSTTDPTPTVEQRLVWDPPIAYSNTYEGTLYLSKLPQEAVVIACRDLMEELGIEISDNAKGCARWWDTNEGRVCQVITIDQPYRGIQPDAVLRHELGHCNGWPSDHPE